MKRPLILVVLFYVVGVLVAGVAQVTPMLLLAGALGVAILALVWPRARLPLLGALTLLAGWANAALHSAILSPHDLRLSFGDDPALAAIRGTLREAPAHRIFVQDEKESWRTLARIDVAAVRLNRRPWQPAVGRVAVTTPEMLTNFFAGQIVEITGVLRRPKIAAAEGTFDYRAYLEGLGIYHQLEASSVRDWQVVSSPSKPPLADRFRAWARPALALGLPMEDESLRLEWALTLGWRPALTEEVSEPFVRAATYHIFAVDGLRMAIIFGIFFGLLRTLRLPSASCGLVLIPLIWFYTALTGWPASAIRANVMLTIVIGGWILKRPSDLLNSLFAAAIIILLWEPRQLFQAGFQLSFFVVLCLILTMPMLHGLWQRIWAPEPLLPESLQPRWRAVLRVPGRFVADVLLTSFAAWIGSIPLVAYYFHIFTPISAPANLVAVPLCGLVLMSNLGSLLLAGWFPAAAILFNHAGWFLMECIRVSSHWFANWPRAYFYVPAPDLLTTLLYYALLLAVITGWLFRPKMRVWKIAAATLLVFFWSGLCWRNSSTTRLHVLPVNGGMAVYFDAPGRKNDLLVDCGTTNSVAFTTKPFLRAQGVNRLPKLVLSHGDSRHVGGARSVAELFNANQVCISPVRFRSPVYRRAVNDFGKTPGLLHTNQAGSQLGSWTVLHPQSGDRFPQADDNALVLYGVFGGARVLLLSDLGGPGQEALLQRTPDLRADILVTGLPARSEALGDKFLDAVQPRLIIVADSEYPVWERASVKFRDRLAQRKTPVLYTRFAGAAVFSFRADDWDLRAMNGARASSQHVTLIGASGQNQAYSSRTVGSPSPAESGDNDDNSDEL
jgi:competence protein ComEC